MAMRVSEKRILNDHASAGTLVVEILTTVLLSLFAWLTYFSFLNINLLNPEAEHDTIPSLLCIVLVPLAAALLTRIPKYGENQLYFWLVPELALFLVTVFTKIYPDGKGDYALKSWWGLLSGNPTNSKWTIGDLIPFALSTNQDNMTLAATLMFLAILLLISAIIADDLCVHRRGVPLLLTLIPILVLVFAGVHYPQGPVRWYLGAYLALLIFAMIFSIGKEKPQKFWKKHINMGISVFLIMAVLLSILVGVLQKDPQWLHDRETRSPKSSMNKKTRQMLEESGMPMGDLRNATENAKKSNYLLYVLLKDGTLDQPVYFRMYTGEEYENDKWSGQLKHTQDTDDKTTAQKSLIPALITGTLAENHKNGTMTVRMCKATSGNNKKKTYDWVKPDDVLPTYATIMKGQLQNYAKAEPGRSTFNQSVFATKGKASAKDGYKVDFARVDLSAYSRSLDVSPEYQKAEEAYARFAKANYGVLTDEEKAVLEPYVQMGWTGTEKSRSFNEARADVQSFLSGHFTMGNKPIEKNDHPLEHLISNKNKNNQTGKYNITPIYAATLETLLLRSEGIPARYVEGMLLNPQSQKPGKYGYRLDYGNAYAWCEVYVNGRGWLPAELGPAKAGGSKDEKKTIRQGGSGNQSASVQRRNTSQKTQQKKGHAGVWIAILIILLLAALVTGIIFLIPAIRRKQELRKFRESDGPENTFRGYRILMKSLRKKNYPASPQHPEWLLSYLGEDYARYLDFVYEERYSEAGLNSEERRFCKDFVLETIANMPKLKKEDMK